MMRCETAPEPDVISENSKGTLPRMAIEGIDNL
jgi:hypothetical protein